MTPTARLTRIRICLIGEAIGLLLSGITAFPLLPEITWLARRLRTPSLFNLAQSTHVLPWIEHVRYGLQTSYAAYPFIAYGTDWLAFAHIVLAILFIGAIREPVRNKWVIQFGLIACAGVLPLAFIAGPIRHIPWGWQCVDASFGIIGCLPLLVALYDVRQLER